MTCENCENWGSHGVLGLESGDEQTLAKFIRSDGGSADRGLSQGLSAGIALSITCILGMAGVERSLIHAVATGEALCHRPAVHRGAQPHCARGTPIASAFAGRARAPYAARMLRELREMIAATMLRTRCYGQITPRTTCHWQRATGGQGAQAAVLDAVLAHPEQPASGPRAGVAL
jgi:hypothetical protein